VAVILYVLSVGPVLRVERNGTAKIMTLRTVYQPLVALARTNSGFGHFYDWYVFHLWKVEI
jgi:hypothetical protein